jgi:hypothetical protein
METAALEEEPEVAKRLLPELEAAYAAAMDELAAIEEEMIRTGAVTGDEEVGEGEPIIEEGMPE